MQLEKRRLSLAEMDAQAALPLPERDMLLITVVITNVLNNLSIDVDVRNINVALQVCAVVNALSAILPVGNTLVCAIQQK